MAKALEHARSSGAAEAAVPSGKQVWADCDPDRSSLGSYGGEALHQATPSRGGAAQAAVPAGAGAAVPVAQAKSVPEQASVENAGGEPPVERNGTSKGKQVWADCDPDRSSLGSYGGEALHRATPSRSGAAQSAVPASAGAAVPVAQAESVPEQASVESAGGEPPVERRGSSKGKLFDDAENPLKIKNTFFHIDMDPSIFEDVEAAKIRQLESAPADLLDHEWHTKFPNMEEAHAKGECKPCAYYVYKRDGCRQGESCPFCHLCTRGEIKRRKKKMVEQRRLEERGDQADDVDEEACDDGLPSGTASESVVDGTSSAPVDGMGGASGAPASAAAARPGKAASRSGKTAPSARGAPAAASASAAPSQPSRRRPSKPGASPAAPAQGLFDAFGRPVTQPPGFGPAVGDVFAAFAGGSWRAQDDDDDDFGYARQPAYVPARAPPAPFVRAAQQ